MLKIENETVSFADALRQQIQVLYALMLRGVRSRFFGNGLGFLVASVGWPFTHMAIIIIIYIVTGRIAPVGDSLILFAATGLVPYITFNYISRNTMIGMAYDRCLLSYPVIKVIDLLVARIFLEILGSCLTAITFLVILYLAGIDFVPHDIEQASFAFAAAIFLGSGMGLINSIIAMAFTAWFTGYVLILIVVYAASGIVFVPDNLPQNYQYYLSFNPVLHAVEWMRSAYYPGYGSHILDKTYLLGWGLCTVFGGLLLERLIRGKVLSM
jgi:capsular polysaccharide transport system permease protein